MNKDIMVVADEYIDRFLVSDLSIIKIRDENYPRMELREALIAKINGRGLTILTAYTFMNELYLEKK